MPLGSVGSLGDSRGTLGRGCGKGHGQSQIQEGPLGILGTLAAPFGRVVVRFVCCVPLITNRNFFFLLKSLRKKIG